MKIRSQSGIPPRHYAEERAVVVGVSEYAVQPLRNAKRDAATVARVLQREYNYRPCSLLNESAGLDSLKRNIEDSLGRATENTRWFFYFAGHGEKLGGEGFLLPFDASNGDSGTYLGLEWLLRLCFASRAGEILIVLDSCYAGQALVRSDLDGWAKAGDKPGPGTLQLLAAGDPEQEVLDDGGEGHSVFTACLLQALEGRPGIHDDDGSLRFTALFEWMDGEVTRRLEAKPQGHQQQLLGVTLRMGPGGDFRFQPGWPRIPSSVVRGIRDGNARMAQRSLKQLETFYKRKAGEPPLPEHWVYSLPLAEHLALLNLPASSGGKSEKPSREITAEVRRRSIRVLGLVGKIERVSRGQVESKPQNRRATKSLLRAALCDQDSAVRHEARRSLRRSLDEASQRCVARRLEETRRQARRPWRGRLWHLLASSPGYRGELDWRPRLQAQGTAVALTTAQGWWWVVRDPWRKWVVIGVVAAFTLFYAFLQAHYYLSTTHTSQVVLRRGLPGFEALPCIGGVAVTSEYTPFDLADPTMATQERFWAPWLALEDGAWAWRFRLVSLLDDSKAGLGFWRLGNLEAALDRLTRDGVAGRQEVVNAATYLAFHSEEAIRPVLDLLLSTLTTSDEELREETLRALEVLRVTQPEKVAGFLHDLVARLESQPDRETLAMIEGLTVLGSGDAAITAALLHRLLVLLETGGSSPEMGPRLEAGLRRLLDAHPDLAARHYDRLLALAQKDPRGREAFLEILQIVSGSHPDAGKALAVLRRCTGPGRAAAVVIAGGLLVARGQPAGVESVTELASLAMDPEPEVVVAAAGVFARLSSRPISSEGFVAQLRHILRQDERSTLRAGAADLLVDLEDEDTDPATLEALISAASDPSPEVRGAVVDALVRLAVEGRAQVHQVEPVLGRGLTDRSPWIRRRARDGVLLLAGISVESYSTAFKAVLPELESRELDPDDYAVQFTQAPPAAAVRFGRRLLRHLAAAKPAESHPYFRLLESVVAKRPETLSRLVPELVVLLAVEKRGLAVETTWFLRRVQVEVKPDLAAMITGFLERLRSPSLADRRAAALVIGQLVADSPRAAEHVLAELQNSLSDSDPDIVGRAAVSLQWIARSHDALAKPALDLLLQGLGDPRPAVRTRFADALAKVAERAEIKFPEPPPSVVRTALEDASPTLRRDVATALAALGKRQPGELATAAGWVRERLLREDDPGVRIQLAAALGTLAGHEPGVVGRVVEIAHEEIRGEEAHQAVSILVDLAEAHSVHARRIANQLKDWRHEVEPQLRGFVVRAMGQVGYAHEPGARAAIDVLETVLSDEDDVYQRFDAVFNGLEPIARFHPAMRPEVLSALESFLGDEALRRETRFYTADAARGRDRIGLGSKVWEAWVKMAVEPAAQDLDLLWRRLASSRRGTRQAGLTILSHVLVQRPDLIPVIRTHVERHRRDRRPDVRQTMAVAGEMIEILHRSRDYLADQESRGRWRQVLEWMPDRAVQPAVSRAREMVQEADG